MRLAELEATLPPEWPQDLLPGIRTLVDASGVKVVVLDDDPTGTQTVHAVDVLTNWSVPTLCAALSSPEPVVYLLTNSRSLPAEEAAALNHDIARNLRAASRQTGRPVSVISRSDSTLRGHYPLETDVLSAELGPYDGLLLVPFFLEGGRYTAGDVHYVAQAGELVQAAETEFARDRVFGYRHSHLAEWAQEKTAGRIAAQEVRSISLAMIREGGPEAVERALLDLHDGAPCVVNALTYRDLEVVVLALLRSESQGKRFLCRTAASFVRVRAGQAPVPLLGSRDLWRAAPERGGLVIVGSHVARTSEQLQAALALRQVTGIELDVASILADGRRESELTRVGAAMEQALARGETAIVYTSRAVVSDADATAALGIGQRVSAALVALVERLAVPPTWLIAKGGITSSDVATRGLGLRRARVLGQAVPGVPVWATPGDSRWPNLVYVVFPGNVGSSTALAEMIAILRDAPTRVVSAEEQI